MIQCKAQVVFQGGKTSTDIYIRLISLYLYQCVFQTLKDNLVSGTPQTLTTVTTNNLQNHLTQNLSCDFIISDFSYRYDQEDITGMISSLNSISFSQPSTFTQTYTQSPQFTF
jgi:hypothetical protein